jgi:hypothetical protein
MKFHQACTIFFVLLIVVFFSMARFLSKDFGGSTSLPENAHLLRVLISIVSCLQSELNLTDKPNGAGFSSHTFGPINNKNPNIWDMEISAFSMIEDALSKIASSLSEDLWQSIVEVLRKVMDFLTARNFIIESSTMSRFYTSFLRCLHSVLSDPKGPLSAHVSIKGKCIYFITENRLFFSLCCNL